MNVKGLDYTCLTLSIIGAINWGLIGIFRFDLVAFLFGDMSWLSRIIYTLVGLSGLYQYLWPDSSGRRYKLRRKREKQNVKAIVLLFPVCLLFPEKYQHSLEMLIFYKETMTFSFAFSGSSASSKEMLRTKVIWYLSPIASRRVMVSEISVSSNFAIFRKLSRYICSRS